METAASLKTILLEKVCHLLLLPLVAGALG
jgi:hypothetical protein